MEQHKVNFANFIQQFRMGHMNKYISQELTELTTSVEQLQRSGEITIKINLKPKNNGEIETSIKCVAKCPRRDTMTAVMFSTAAGALVDRDPNQNEMFIEAKELPTATNYGVRDVVEATN